MVLWVEGIMFNICCKNRQNKCFGLCLLGWISLTINYRLCTLLNSGVLLFENHYSDRIWVSRIWCEYQLVHYAIVKLLLNFEKRAQCIKVLPKCSASSAGKGKTSLWSVYFGLIISELRKLCTLLNSGVLLFETHHS